MLDRSGGGGRRHWYDVATRSLGSLWFLLLAAISANEAWLGLAPHNGHAVWPILLARGCLAIFYVGLSAIMIFRPPAVAKAAGLLPTLAAFVGTYLPLSIPLFGHPRHSELLNLASAVCLLVGAVFMVITLAHLGRSFSIVPQAHRVVSAGPYRCIRHPLYLSEEIAILGTVLQYHLSLLIVLVLVAQFAIQIRRILYEEELLRRTLPEYVVYERTRWRLVPFVW
jgi:protein-S-isoprenylcysteine O-methyltransferase Ste14